MTVKILGICGSPIEGGNTETILNLALEAASSTPDLETEMFTVAHKEFKGCIHCNWCLYRQAEGPEDKFCAQEDDLSILYSKIIEADGLLVATPVYLRNASWQTFAIQHRMRALIEGQRYRGKDMLGNKVVGGLAVSWFRDSGAESALMTIRNWRGIQVGGVAAVSSLDGKGKRDKENLNDKLLVLKDEMAIKKARALGYKVAEVCRKLRMGEEALTKTKNENDRGT